MDFALNAIPGLAIAAGLYFVYLVATRGLPAAWAWVKAKWTSARSELASLESALGGEIDEVKAVVDSHQGVIAALQKGFDALSADVEKLKGSVAPAPAPQPQAAAAPAAPAPANAAQ